MPDSFLFYDFETDGAEPTICRPFQFAAIRTDESLRIVEEEETVLWCRPSMDRLPAPEACLVTGITPQKAAAKGQTEAPFFNDIHRRFMESGTTSLGWNTLRFDDVVCRFGFWRNYLDPYEHSWRNGCRAWDLIDLTRAARALRPQGIQWSQHDNGNPSFKLEHLSAANDIEHEDAHDALSDVRATIAIGRLLKKAQPDLWTWARSLTDTKKAERILQDPAPFVHVSARISSHYGCTSPMRVLTEHPRNKRSFLCWDLRHDPTDLLEADVDDILHRTFSRQEDLDEAQSRFAIKEIKSNRAPFLAPLGVLESADHDLLKLDEKTWRKHDSILDSNRTKLESLGHRLRKAWAPVEQKRLDAADALYQDFPSDEDSRLRTRVARTRPEDLADIGDRFKDSRLRDMMLHYRAREAPGTLDHEEQTRWLERCRTRLEVPPGKGDLPWTEWIQHVSTLMSAADISTRDFEILNSVKTWGLERAADLGLPIPGTS